MERIDRAERTSAPPTSDSKTVVYQRIHGQRDVVSIRIKPEIKEALNEFCRANGLSLCHIIEGLTTGYLVGMQQKITWVNQSPTINLTLVRDVKRLRRYAVEKEVKPSSFVERGSIEKCAFCEAKSFARCVDDDVVVWLCQPHFVRFKSRLRGWMYVKE
jgi:hypothetical protein